ncbi:MAG: HAMP domain-containing sensor histidine kinase [Balneolaceae bacterium]
MKYFATSGKIKILLIFLLLSLGAGSVIYNQYLVNKILEQERSSVELLAKGYQYMTLPVNEQAGTKLLQAIELLRDNPTVPDSVLRLINSAESSISTGDFVYTEIILENRFKIPAIVVDTNNTILFDRNINKMDELKTAKDSSDLVKAYKALNVPIKIVIGDDKKQIEQFVYYGESPTVQMLRYFPYAQILALTLLLGIGYTTYSSITRSEQSNLWVGMAKEAAHQLGTPISSLYGWIQLMKDELPDNEFANTITTEIENDVKRLAGVAERFGKIGSEPELKTMDIQPILESVVQYMERRLPSLGKKVEVKKVLNAHGEVNINPELFQWAVENLVKNAMDSLPKDQADSFISVSSKVEGDKVIIDIEDSGIGIDIKHIKNIFKPGFSTKKRGWGLGLSLTKRIIEDYHDGHVYVLRSELDEGTTIRIALKLNS